MFSPQPEQDALNMVKCPPRQAQTREIAKARHTTLLKCREHPVIAPISVSRSMKAAIEDANRLSRAKPVRHPPVGSQIPIHMALTDADWLLL